MTNFERELGNRKVGFLIRKFEERNDRATLVNTVRDTFRLRGLTIVDANEKTLNPEAWGNVKEFLDHCTFGVVIIDNLSPTTAGFNPNVFLEIGYLLALKKSIFILIQNSYGFYKSKDLTVNLEINHAEQVFVSDITYIKLASQHAYLALVTDA